MAFGYGHPNVDAAESAVGAGIGTGVGVVQAVALDFVDSEGKLGAPLITGVKNSQLADFGVGGVTAGLGLAGAFGKGPLKAKQGAAAAAAGYGLGQAIVGAILLVTGTSVAGPARATPAGRWGGAGQGRGSPARAGVVTPPSGNQQVIADLSY